MTREGPAWLAELQARFGAAIRTPLDRSSGTLAATEAAYDPRLVELLQGGRGVGAAGRLAVYNRQYWFRLFEALQDAFPLTMRLLGAWTFNGHAARFVLAHPPRGWDLDRVPHGFEAFLEAELERDAAPDRAALVESARLDAAWRAVFRAPGTRPFRPSAADASRLLEARLLPSPAVELVVEHWPLLELRRKVMAERAERRVPLPPPLPRARSWALVRTDEAIGQLPLEDREAELLALLRTAPVREALARLEQACTPGEREELPARARGWLARSVQLGFWIGTA
ncbi:MAG TPA: DNA-binding domain-containing protein [Myxococcales bacterium]|nr:DNA-binding domain-containing protein [Myxococcales bacterium]